MSEFQSDKKYYVNIFKEIDVPYNRAYLKFLNKSREKSGIPIDVEMNFDQGSGLLIPSESFFFYYEYDEKKAQDFCNLCNSKYKTNSILINLVCHETSFTDIIDPYKRSLFEDFQHNLDHLANYFNLDSASFYFTELNRFDSNLKIYNFLDLDKSGLIKFSYNTLTDSDLKKSFNVAKKKSKKRYDLFKDSKENDKKFKKKLETNFELLEKIIKKESQELPVLFQRLKDKYEVN